MQNALRARFRHGVIPSPGVPLGARSVGDFSVFPGWKDAVAAKSFVQIFWGVRGTGRIIIDDEDLRLGPGMIAVYARGMTHRLEALDERWDYRWWTMDGEAAGDIVAGLGLAPGVHTAGSVPVRLFKSLEAHIARCLTRADELAADAAAYHLLMEAASRIDRSTGVESKTPAVRRAAVRCLRSFFDPACNVGSIASEIGINRSLLSRRFTDEMGVSPVGFLARIRLDNARHMLRETGVDVADIARQCGFSDANYFARRFKAVEGVTPVEYRRLQVEKRRQNTGGADTARR